MPTLHIEPATIALTLWYFKCQQPIFDEQPNNSKTACTLI